MVQEWRTGSWNHLEAVMALNLCGKKKTSNAVLIIFLTPNSMTARGGDNLEALFHWMKV